MKTDTLQDLIVDMLGLQQLTISQLHAQLNTDDRVREIKLGAPRLSQVLRAMLKKGTIAFVKHDNWDTHRRYYVPADAYRADKSHHTGAWMVLKYDEGRFNAVILGDNFSEPDARTCAASLNDRDRKVRGIKS